MKILQWSSFILLVILFTLFAPRAGAQTSGSFMVVKGEVTVTSKDGQTEKAKIGKKVVPSDIITAGADSRAKIVMADKNVINISPDTKLALEKYVFDPATDNKQVTLNVLYGKVRATVEQKYDGEKNQFHVKTPSAVAGVRGTDFLTSYNPKTDQTKVVTFTGTVAVGLPGIGGKIQNPVMVKPGEFTEASKSSPPAAPAPVPKSELTSMKTESSADTGGGKPAPKSGPEGQNKDNKDQDKDKDKKQEAKADAKDQKQEAKAEAKAEPKPEVKQDQPQQEKPAANNANAPAADSRAPAAADAPAAGPAPAAGDPAGGSANSPPPSSSNSAGPAPASVGSPPPPMMPAPPPTSMISAADMNTGAVTVDIIKPMAPMPPANLNPVQNIIPKQVTSGVQDIINSNLQNGPAKVNITINKK